ncbi:hypothetical protein [Brucella oryzae]|uniref:hypothetical protein n=1 Tax=Brucella oryzae TaxID=335286 RepID=UPI0035BC3BA4
MRIFHIALAFSLLVAGNAIAQDQPVDQQIDDALGDHTKFRPVIEGVQKAVASHDAEALSKLISYPIAVKIHGKEQIIKSAKSFIENYDGIVTANIAKIVTGQKYEDLFVSYRGIMFGNGQVWINGICHDNACKNFSVKVTNIQEVK